MANADDRDTPGSQEAPSAVAGSPDSPPNRFDADVCCPVVELRQYTLHPGQREVLIDLFDREFVETQEVTGMCVIAQFRDIDRPDVFTWLRGFRDMPSRAAALSAFYGGPVWAKHRDAANGTMVSSDNVRLLRPARPGSGFVLGNRSASPATVPSNLIVATIYTLSAAAAVGFVEFFDAVVAPSLSASGASPFAMLETEPSANTYPRLPVREGERAFVWFARFSSVAAHETHRTALAADRHWTSVVEPGLLSKLVAPPEVWRLTPTARSRTLG